jgi:hypothetical protein
MLGIMLPCCSIALVHGTYVDAEQVSSNQMASIGGFLDKIWLGREDPKIGNRNG